MKNKVKDLIIMDINSVVRSLDAEQTLKIVTTHGILFWDSLNTATIIEPKLIPSETFGKYENIKIVDVSNPDQYKGHKHILENEK